MSGKVRGRGGDAGGSERFEEKRWERFEVSKITGGGGERGWLVTRGKSNRQAEDGRPPVRDRALRSRPRARVRGSDTAVARPAARRPPPPRDLLPTRSRPPSLFPPPPPTPTKLSPSKDRRTRPQPEARCRGVAGAS